MPFVEDNPAVAAGVADSQSEDEMSYEEMCEESLDNAEMFRRGRRPPLTVVRGEVALRVPATATDREGRVNDLVQSLFRRVLGQPLWVNGPTCRLSLEVRLQSVEDEGDEPVQVDGAVCCKATEVYDDGIIIKTVLPEGQVERCSVIPEGCSYRQAGRW
jgi:hypothetical protein